MFIPDVYSRLSFPMNSPEDFYPIRSPCVQCGVTKRAPAGVKPLEVRFAHPVRLSPATHSQGHGRPCLQRLHPRQGFCDHVDFPGGHSLGMSHEKLHSVKKSRQFLTKSVLKAILLKKTGLFLTKRRAMFSEVIIIANFAAALLQGRVRIPIGG